MASEYAELVAKARNFAQTKVSSPAVRDLLTELARTIELLELEVERQRQKNEHIAYRLDQIAEKVEHLRDHSVHQSIRR